MDAELRELYVAAKNFHEKCYRIISKKTETLKKSNDQRELADAVYAINAAAKYVDDSHKEMNRLEDLLEKITCLIWSRDSPDGESIGTDYCVAIPDIKMMASLPHPRRNPKEFLDLMEFMGVPRALTDVGEGRKPVVQADFNGFADYLTDLARNGRPLPPGITVEKTYPVFKVQVRKRKEVDAE